MAKVIRCDCGVVVTAETDEELVQAAQKHAKEAHGLTITREQALAICEEA